MKRTEDERKDPIEPRESRVSPKDPPAAEYHALAADPPMVT